MKIQFKLSKASQIEEMDALKQLAIQLRQLPREEEHHLVFASQSGTSAFLSAAAVALVEQKRREGYLLTIENQGTFLLPEIFEVAKNEAELEKLIGQFPERSDLKIFFLYVAGELIDNIIEHARISFGTVAFVDDERFSLTAVDTGISIPSAYREAGISISDDCDALQKALTGVSTKTVEERGRGLSSVNLLITQALRGELVIFSAGGLLRQTAGGAQCQNSPFYWQGTIVSVSGPLPKEPVNIYDYIS